MVETDISSIRSHSNESHIYTILGSALDRPIQGLFKPASGESPTRLREFNIAKMYPREVAAYLVDYYAKLGIVPPTVKREMDGSVGSLQLYVDPHIALNPDRISDLNHDDLARSSSWKKMALLDKLISNADRDQTNYLVGLEHSDLVIAIDHGCSLCQVRKGDKSDALDYFERHPENAMINDMRPYLENLINSEGEIFNIEEGGELPEERALLEVYDVIPKAKAMLEQNNLLI